MCARVFKAHLTEPAQLNPYKRVSHKRRHLVHHVTLRHKMDWMCCFFWKTMTVKSNIFMQIMQKSKTCRKLLIVWIHIYLHCVSSLLCFIIKKLLKVSLLLLGFYSLFFCCSTFYHVWSILEIRFQQWNRNRVYLLFVTWQLHLNILHDAAGLNMKLRSCFQSQSVPQWRIQGKHLRFGQIQVELF